jgi:hypothetical protein
MKPELFSYLKKLAVFVFALSMVLFLWGRFLPSRFCTHSGWMLLGFFTIASIVFHSILTSSAKGDAQSFIRTFMAATGIKLMVYFFVILIYLLLNREDAIGFTLTFLFLYLCFSVFEVTVLLKHFKKK